MKAEDATKFLEAVNNTLTLISSNQILMWFIIILIVIIVFKAITLDILNFISEKKSDSLITDCTKALGACESVLRNIQKKKNKKKP